MFCILFIDVDTYKVMNKESGDMLGQFVAYSIPIYNRLYVVSGQNPACHPSHNVKFTSKKIDIMKKLYIAVLVCSLVENMSQINELQIILIFEHSN